MILIDKGYFDYDFEKVGILDEGNDWIDTVRSEEDVRNLVSGFGLGVKKKPETDEEIQKHILNQGGK